MTRPYVMRTLEVDRDSTMRSRDPEWLRTPRRSRRASFESMLDESLRKAKEENA